MLPLKFYCFRHVLKLGPTLFFPGAWYIQRYWQRQCQNTNQGNSGRTNQGINWREWGKWILPQHNWNHRHYCHVHHHPDDHRIHLVPSLAEEEEDLQRKRRNYEKDFQSLCSKELNFKDIWFFGEIFLFDFLQCGKCDGT